MMKLGGTTTTCSNYSDKVYATIGLLCFCLLILPGYAFGKAYSKFEDEAYQLAKELAQELQKITRDASDVAEILLRAHELKTQDASDGSFDASFETALEDTYLGDGYTFKEVAGIFQGSVIVQRQGQSILEAVLRHAFSPDNPNTKVSLRWALNPIHVQQAPYAESLLDVYAFGVPLDPAYPGPYVMGARFLQHIRGPGSKEEGITEQDQHGFIFRDIYENSWAQPFNRVVLTMLTDEEREHYEVSLGEVQTDRRLDAGLADPVIRIWAKEADTARQFHLGVRLYLSGMLPEEIPLGEAIGSIAWNLTGDSIGEYLFQGDGPPSVAHFVPSAAAVKAPAWALRFAAWAKTTLPNAPAWLTKLAPYAAISTPFAYKAGKATLADSDHERVAHLEEAAQMAQLFLILRGGQGLASRSYPATPPQAQVQPQLTGKIPHTAQAPRVSAKNPARNPALSRRPSASSRPRRQSALPAPIARQIAVGGSLVPDSIPGDSMQTKPHAPVLLPNADPHRFLRHDLRQEVATLEMSRLFLQNTMSQTAQVSDALDALHHISQAMRSMTDTLSTSATGHSPLRTLHQLKNLARTIKPHVIAIQTINDDQLEPSAVQALDYARQVVITLTQQIINLADGNIPTHLNEVIERLADRYNHSSVRNLHPDAMQAHLNLTDTTAIILKAGAQLRRMISNLLVNAHEAGAQNVWVTATQSTTGTVIIEVRDDAGGMDQAVQDALFQEGATTKNQADHGLGLASVKRMVEALDGNIEIETSVAEGHSTFILEIPVSTADHLNT